MARKKASPVVKKSNENSKKDRSNKSISYFLMFLAALAIIFIIFYYIFSGIGKLSYQGLTFTKTKFGNIDVYLHTYYLKDAKGQLYQYNMYLRNNPKTNNVTITGDSINLLFNKDIPVVLGFDNSGLANCSNGVLAADSISKFVSSNQINKAVGVTTAEDAKFYNMTQVSCQKFSRYNVILLQKGDYTGVDVDGNCYTITAGNDCRILEAVEKFEVQTIVDSKKRMI